MSALLRSLSLALATGCIVVAAIGAAHAAGAFAVGSCGAYGYAYDYKHLADARTAAAKKCSGGCKVVGAIRRGCAALAVDVKDPCGSYGWALNSHLGKAENMSLRRCYEFGGRDCVVRAWACDEKG